MRPLVRCSVATPGARRPRNSSAQTVPSGTQSPAIPAGLLAKAQPAMVIGLTFWHDEVREKAEAQLLFAGDAIIQALIDSSMLEVYK